MTIDELIEDAIGSALNDNAKSDVDKEGNVCSQEYVIEDEFDDVIKQAIKNIKNIKKLKIEVVKKEIEDLKIKITELESKLSTYIKISSNTQLENKQIYECGYKEDYKEGVADTIKKVSK